MTHPIRSLAAAACVIALAATVAACGSSGSDADAGRATTTGAEATTTVVTTTAAPPTAEPGGDATTSSTYAGTADGLPACDDLNREYTDRFTMDDLADAAAFFREYAPFMPEDVGAASLRIAEAYEAAGGDPANLDFGSVDLTADAQTFSDWINDGCPAG